jgi:Fe-S oxidoreductase
VSCKACKRECPTGVDMARMKIEVLYQHHAAHGISLRDRLVSFLPRYAPIASRFGALLNLRNRSPFLRAAGERLAGVSRDRTLPRWSPRPFRDSELPAASPVGEVALLADTFGRWFEPGVLRAAAAVLNAAQWSVHVLRASDGDGSRPLCCGRTFLASGLVDEAREELRRLVDAALPFVRRGIPIVGLEPSCLLTLRDEARAVLPGEATAAVAAKAFLFEELVAAEHAAGRLSLPLGPSPWRGALVHGHCHQKALGALAPTEAVLRLVPGLEVAHVASSCCGMAGSFGYHAEHYALSLKMAEEGLLPAVRAAGADTVVVADGTSCRHQIEDGAAREAVHAAVVLHAALEPPRPTDRSGPASTPRRTGR